MKITLVFLCTFFMALPIYANPYDECVLQTTHSPFGEVQSSVIPSYCNCIVERSGNNKENVDILNLKTLDTNCLPNLSSFKVIDPITDAVTTSINVNSLDKSALLQYECNDEMEAIAIAPDEPLFSSTASILIRFDKGVTKTREVIKSPLIFKQYVIPPLYTPDTLLDLQNSRKLVIRGLDETNHPIWTHIFNLDGLNEKLALEATHNGCKWKNLEPISSQKKEEVIAWVVEVGIFSKKIHALQLISTLRENGFPTPDSDEIHINGKSSYRVIIGPFLRKDLANSLLTQIEKLSGLKAKVTTFK